MKTRKIGPGVYAVEPLGEIEMNAWVIAERRIAGLPTPSAPRYLTTDEATAKRARVRQAIRTAKGDQIP